MSSYTKFKDEWVALYNQGMSMKAIGGTRLRPFTRYSSFSSKILRSLRMDDRLSRIRVVVDGLSVIFSKI